VDDAVRRVMDDLTVTQQDMVVRFMIAGYTRILEDEAAYAMRLA